MAVFLMYNMGCSGGSWFEKICNTHPEVRAWEEVARTLGFFGANMLGRIQATSIDRAQATAMYDVVLWFLANQARRHRSVGLIKTFDLAIVDYCLSQGGTVVQMVRNPIKVIGFKYPRAVWTANRNGERQSEIEVFENHVRRYANRYRLYMDRDYQLIRVEDLSASLAATPAAPHFCRTMEYITQVEWNEEAVGRVRREAHPRGREDIPDPDCWKSDPFIEAHYGARGVLESRSRGAHSWEIWDADRRKIFLKYFEPIMAALGYNYGD